MRAGLEEDRVQLRDIGHGEGRRSTSRTLLGVDEMPKPRGAKVEGVAAVVVGTRKAVLQVRVTRARCRGSFFRALDLGSGLGGAEVVG